MLFVVILEVMFVPLIFVSMKLFTIYHSCHIPNNFFMGGFGHLMVAYENSIFYFSSIIVMKMLWKCVVLIPLCG